MNSRLVRAAAFAIPVLLLAACGGGGGDGSSEAPAQPASSGIVITGTNAQSVAAEALEVSTNTDTASGGGLVTAVQVDAGPATTGNVRLATVARSLLAMAPASGAQATGVTTSETVSCAVSGSLTVSSSIAGSSVLVAGDSMSMTANNCVEAAGSSMNGTMTITIVAGTLDPASTSYPKSVTIRLEAQNFSFSMDGETSVSNGDMQFTLTENSATDVSISMSGSLLSSNIGGATVTLKNYSHSVSTTASGTTIQIQGTVETTGLGSGTVSYQISTPSALTLNASGQFTGGSLKVTGNGSSLLLTVTGTDAFSLQVDTNGDGAYDSTTSVTRSQLQAAL